jgi:hypothetical protein
MTERSKSVKVLEEIFNDGQKKSNDIKDTDIQTN